MFKTQMRFRQLFMHCCKFLCECNLVVHGKLYSFILAQSAFSFDQLDTAMVLVSYKLRRYKCVCLLRARVFVCFPRLSEEQNHSYSCSRSTMRLVVIAKLSLFSRSFTIKLARDTVLSRFINLFIFMRRVIRFLPLSLLFS